MDRPKGSLVAYEIIAPSASAAGDLSAKYAVADKSACCMTAWLLHAAIMTAAGFKYKHPWEPSLDTIMFAAIANLRIFTKISLGVASVLGLLVVASTWTYISMSRLDSLFAEYRDRAELITLADKLLGDMNSYGFIAQSYARTGEETLLGKASEIGGAVNDGVANLRKAMRKADKIALLDRADQKNQELAQQMSDVYEARAALAGGRQSDSAAGAMKDNPIDGLAARSHVKARS